MESNKLYIHEPTAETANNGTYQWRSREDRFLRAVVYEELPDAPPSACDYVIAVRDDKTTAHSGYFTIINNNDDGLPDDAECPDSKAPPPPTGGSNSNSNLENEESQGNGDEKSGDGSSEENNVSPDGSSEGNDASSDGRSLVHFLYSIQYFPNIIFYLGGESSSSGNSESGTVTTAMLGGAVGGAAGGLILIFSAILLLGRSKGWFVKEEYIEKRVSAAVLNIMEGNEDIKSHFVRNTTEAREISSQPIHQLAA